MTHTMHTKTCFLGLAAALLIVSTALPAQAAVVPATININDVPTYLAGIDVIETSDVANDARIIADTSAPAATVVTFDLYMFDRNGELGITQPTMSLYVPTSSGTPSCTGTLATTATEKTTFTGFTNGGTVTATLTDAVGNNGIGKYSPTVTFNTGGAASPAGEYCVKIVDGAGAVNYFTVVVYQGINIVLATTSSSTGADDGVLGSVTFTTGVNPTATNVAATKTLRVKNAGTTGSFNVKLTYNDLATGSATYGKILMSNNVAVTELKSSSATATPPSPGTTNSLSTADYTQTSPAVGPGENIVFGMRVLSLANNGQTNNVVANGALTGNLVVNLTGPGGAPVSGGGTYTSLDPDATYTPGGSDTTDNAYNTASGSRDMSNTNPDGLGGPITIA